MDVVALLVFCATIILAFVFKVNTGLIAIVAALVLSRFVDIGDKWLLNSFDSSLFLMLLGVMYLFCIAQENKTLDVFKFFACVIIAATHLPSMFESEMENFYFNPTKNYNIWNALLYGKAKQEKNLQTLMLWTHTS